MEKMSCQVLKAPTEESLNENDQVFFTLPNSFPNQDAEKLFQLIETYELNGLKNLFKEDPQVNLLTVATPDGKSALHYAVIKNDGDIVHYLLSLAVLSPHMS